MERAKRLVDHIGFWPEYFVTPSDHPDFRGMVIPGWGSRAASESLGSYPRVERLPPCATPTATSKTGFRIRMSAITGGLSNGARAGNATGSRGGRTTRRLT